MGSLWSTGWSELRAEIASLKSQVLYDFDILRPCTCAEIVGEQSGARGGESTMPRCTGDGDTGAMKGSRFRECSPRFSCSILFHSLVIFGLVSIQVFPCVPHIPPSSHIRLTFWRFTFSSKSGHAFASAETCDFEVICGGRPRKRSPLFILFMSCSFDIYIFCCFMLFPMCILFEQVYIRAQ